MAEIKSPLSGGLQVARRTVSADAFVRSAPPVVVRSEPDPVTTSLIQKNSLALNTVSNQLTSLSQQVIGLNAAMQSVYGNISQRSALERREDIQEQNQERRLAEQQLREGKESIIERKIQNALIYPVQKISQKASFTLSRLMSFFYTLLGGWLLNQGIQTIKAFGEGNRRKLEEIRNNVLKNLGIVAGVYAGIRFGLTAIFNVLTRVASRVTSAVAVGLFLRPVQALLDGVRSAANKIIPKIKNILPGFSKPGGTPPGGKPPGGTPRGTPPQPPKTTAEASRQVGQRGINRLAPTSLVAPLLGGAIGGTADVMQGEDPAKAYTTNIGGAAASTYAAGLVSRLPLPPLIKAPLVFGTGFGLFGPATEGLKGLYDKTTEMFSGASGGPGIDKNLLSQPIQSKISDIAFKSENLMGDQKKPEQASDITAQASQQDFTQPPQYGEISVAQLSSEMMGTETAQVSTEGLTTTQLKTPQVEIIPLKPERAIKPESVGPLPEPAPTIIPMPMGASTTASKPKAPTQTGGAANTIPTIDPENPNNFYIVYSHSVYNVPLT